MIAARYRRWEVGLCVAVAVLALFAVGRHPYGYYLVLRWAAFVAGGVLAYRFFAVGLIGTALLFGATAGLFNPVFPFYLDRETWQVFDIICATVFLFGAAISPRLDKSKAEKASGAT